MSAPTPGRRCTRCNDRWCAGPPHRARRPWPGGPRERQAACRAGAAGPRFVGATLGPRGLAKPIRERRLGGVPRVLAGPTLSLGRPRLQRDNQAGLFGVGRAQLGDHHGLDRHGGFQLRVGGRVLRPPTAAARKSHCGYRIAYELFVAEVRGLLGELEISRSLRPPIHHLHYFNCMKTA
jgi:hypothetical protein